MTPKETAFKLYFEFYRDIIANSEKAKNILNWTAMKSGMQKIGHQVL